MTGGAGAPGLTLRGVRRMLEGVVPPAMCTASADGVPHVNYLSQAEFVDDEHIALSFQFFNRSRENVLSTRRAVLSVDDPYTGAGVVMRLAYLRTETAGPVFERMRAKLAGIASHTGMENVFALRGADVYRVLALRPVPGRRELPATLARCDLAAGGRALSQRLAACEDLPALLDTFMDGLARDLRIDHAMLWLVERPRQCLVLLASRGYAHSGLGAEMPLTAGLAGVAAREGVPVRVGHMTKMYTYGRAVRAQAQSLGLDPLLADEIPLPGLEAPRSQIAVPLVARGTTIGVLFAESLHDQFFSYDDEDALQLVGSQLAGLVALLQATEAAEGRALAAVAGGTPAGGAAPLRVRRVAADHSVFLDGDYLIRGVAGAIFWKLACAHVEQGRCDFTNRRTAQRARPAAARRAGQPRGAPAAVAAAAGRAQQPGADRAHRARHVPPAGEPAAAARPGQLNGRGPGGR
ncbi:GAF domain-containing protein [Ramlibacter sp.]